MSRPRPNRSVLAAAALAAVLAAAPSGARAATLIEVLVEAYNSNPRIAAARAALKAVDEQAAQAVSLFRPTFTGTATVGRTVSGTENRRTGSSHNRLTPASLSLTVSQPLFRGGREYAEWNRAHNAIRAQRARLFDTEQTVLLEVVTAYMNVVRDEAILRLRASNLAVLQRQLQATRDRFAVGEVTRTDVAQSEASVARADAQRIQAQGNLEASRAAYLSLVGRPPMRLVEPRTTPVILPANRQLVIDTATRNAPALLAAYFDAAAARDTVESVTGELLPTLTLSGTFSRTYDSSTRDTRTDSAGVLLTLTVPLYESGSVYSRVRAAKQTVWQRLNELAQARRAATEAAIRAWEALATARASARAFESEARANAIALEGVRQENRNGLRTILDVLDAEQRLLDSNVNLISARRDVIVATYQVAAAMGRMTALDLKLPVKPYDVEAYYRAVRFLPFGTGPALPARPGNPQAGD
jgi:outer membrane protein